LGHAAYLSQQNTLSQPRSFFHRAQRITERLTSAALDAELSSVPFLRNQGCNRKSISMLRRVISCVVLVRRGGGQIKTGRVLYYWKKRNRKMCSLYLSLLDKAGVRLGSFGDSKERLAEV